MFIARWERTMRNARPKLGLEPTAKPEQAPTSIKAVGNRADVHWPKTPARQIIQQVAAAHGFTTEDVVGGGLKKKLVQARFDAIKAVADGRPDLSLPQIGHIFNRDHTSIIHALKKRGGRKNREG